MELIRGLHNLKKQSTSYVVSIGNFDGVHIGHQKVINHLKEKSRQYQLPSLLMIFEPHPKEFFSRFNDKIEPPPRLNRFRDKITLLQKYQVDYLLVVNFTRKFSRLSAQDFVQKILVNQLNARHVMIGDDFCYGKNRQGNYRHLLEQGKKFGFDVSETATCEFQQQRVSSSRIRELLAIGDLQSSEALLGRHYFISGHVLHGAKKGRTIGFPTANLGLKFHKPVTIGVFAVRLTINCDNTSYNGVANIGYRPTVNGKKPLLEVHLFEFNREIYSKIVKVELLTKIRDEKKFDSFEMLKDQIAQDVETAKNYFKT